MLTGNSPSFIPQGKRNVGATRLWFMSELKLRPLRGAALRASGVISQSRNPDFDSIFDFLWLRISIFRGYVANSEV